MKKEHVEFYKLAINEWGEEAQLRMCIEEMSELTKEICKYIRNLRDDNQNPNFEKNLLLVRENIKEEVADVLNMAEQLKFIFGEQEIEQIRDKKIQREKARLEKATPKNRENSNTKK